MSLYISFTSPEVFFQWVFFQKTEALEMRENFAVGRTTRITSIIANSTVGWKLGYPPLQWPKI